MPKHIHCAQCGQELLLLRKALKGKVYDLIEPHLCDSEVNDPIPGSGFVPMTKPHPIMMDEHFKPFKFVQKINDLNAKSTEDKRSTEHLRKELKTSTAPVNILDQIKHMQNSIPAGNINEEPEDD